MRLSCFVVLVPVASLGCANPAYGAPTITIPWEQLADIAADTQESVRFGY